MDETTNSEIDAIDLRILRLLQADGRLSNVELAERAHLSAATCHRRTQRLFARGVIGAVRAAIDPASVGLGAIALVGLVLDRSTPDAFRSLEAAIMDLPMVLDCHLVAGEFDYLLKIRVRDLADFNRLHAERLIALPGVRQARTFFVLKEVKDAGPLDF